MILTNLMVLVHPTQFFNFFKRTVAETLTVHPFCDAVNLRPVRSSTPTFPRAT
jgi:hypothetical protein